MKPFLSVIIPAHDDSAALPVTLVDIDKNLSESEYSYEILVVGDGSENRTSGAMNLLSRAIKNLKFLDVNGWHGKGWAVREGMLKATGNYRLVINASNPVSVNNFNAMLPGFKEGYDILIGSSRAKGAGVILFYLENLVFRVFSGRIVRDVLSDFKCFSESTAVRIFSAAKINGWGFDVEALNLAKLFNCRILEVPVSRSSDSVKALSVGKFFSAIWDSVRVRFWLSRGRYAAQ